MNQYESIALFLCGHHTLPGLPGISRSLWSLDIPGREKSVPSTLMKDSKLQFMLFPTEEGTWVVYRDP